MTTNQTPELDAAVERVRSAARKYKPWMSIGDKASPPLVAAIRTELEQAYAAGRRDALVEMSTDLAKRLATPTETAQEEKNG